MTLIECFDRSPLENVVGALSLNPDRLIFIGREEQIEKARPKYQDFFTKKGLKTQVFTQKLDQSDLNEMVQVLTDLVRAEGECLFDVTGGDDQVVMAVGAVFASLKYSHPVKVQRFDIHTGAPLDCDGDGVTLPARPAAVSVSDLVELYDGAVVVSRQEINLDPPRIDALWNVVISDPRAWNREMAALYEFESRNATPHEIYLQPHWFSHEIADYGVKKARYENMLSKLERHGLIDNRSYQNTVRYSYVDPEVRRWLSKAGNVLELKTYKEARSLQQEGKPYFDDCQIGVLVDWDGVILNGPPSRETRNEVDVVLTRGLIPLFVSCKNGGVDERELYKLSTVAHRFGGPYAKMMLIATDFEPGSDSTDSAFIRRAAEMGIYVVADGAQLDAAGWEQAFKRAMEQ